MKKRRTQILAVFLTIALMLTFCMSAFAMGDAIPAKPFANSKFYKQGDYSIHYRVVPPAKPQKDPQRIVMIHGFLSSTVFYEPLADLMSRQGYECVLVDLPGFGYSTRETADIKPIVRERLVYGLLESIQSGAKWIVAGHSMGGGVAANFAAMYPRQVSALILLAPAVGMSEGSNSNRISVSIPKEMYGQFLNLTAQVLCNIKPVVRLLFALSSSEYKTALTYDVTRISKPLLVKNTGMSLAYMWERAAPNDMAKIKALKMPILMITGTKDALVNAESTDAFAKVMPKMKLASIDSGHFFPEVRAQQTAGFMLNFLSGKL